MLEVDRVTSAQERGTPSSHEEAREDDTNFLFLDLSPYGRVQGILERPESDYT